MHGKGSLPNCFSGNGERMSMCWRADISLLLPILGPGQLELVSGSCINVPFIWKHHVSCGAFTAHFHDVLIIMS